jgi:hypothetical protein
MLTFLEAFHALIFNTSQTEIGGLKTATKVLDRRDGEKFLKQEITEFKIGDRLDGKAFVKQERYGTLPKLRARYGQEDLEELFFKLVS